MYTQQKVILSADNFERGDLLELIKKIGSQVFAVKIHNLYDTFGPSIVKDLHQAGAARVWVDFKLHDIPNTVSLRAKALAESGCEIITVHASGGVEMMSAAKQAFGPGKIYAVTALTSLNDEAIKNIYQSSGAEELVVRLASLVSQAGLDGLVCSPKEISAIRANPAYSKLELVTPGIRSSGVSADDQKRFDTPANALKAGANYLVIGRQITKAADPLQAIKDLELEIAGALSNV